MLNTFRFVLLLSIVVWVGGLVFFTFFVTPIVFKVLPRELAGELVASIFPKYWALGYVAGVLSLASLLAISLIEKFFPAGRILLLAFMTALTFYSGMVIAPEARAVQLELKAAKEPARVQELRAEFRHKHLESYAINMAVIVSGVVFVFFTARSARL
ncbi:MAG: DUF4149 domain-containing protein [Deltaproteobacteria bacterium]|nr:DUF4149 domain-containing protein [Deltaproteobacteria bacterium]